MNERSTTRGLNIFSNIVLNKLVTGDDWDSPWMNEFVKYKIKWKNEIFKNYIKNVRAETSYFKLQGAINTVSETDKRKYDYNCHVASKSNNRETNPKTY